MRYNDTLSAAHVDFGRTRERTNPRIARALYAGYLLSIHARARLVEVRCAFGVPRGPFRSPTTGGLMDVAPTARTADGEPRRNGRLWVHLPPLSRGLALPAH